MPVLALTYDLFEEPGRAYEELGAAIKKLGSWCRPTKSTWFVDTSLSSQQVIVRLTPHLHLKDKLTITTLTKDGSASMWGLSPQVREWIRCHLAKSLGLKVPTLPVNRLGMRR